MFEIRRAVHACLTQVALPIVYDGHRRDSDLVVDMIVDDGLLVDLKATDRLLPVHKAQVIFDLKLSGLRLGLLRHFNVPLMKEGVSCFADEK